MTFPLGKFTLAVATASVLSLSALTAQAAGLTYPFTNTFDTAIINGDYGEWLPLASNVHVPMYEAGNPTKDVLSDLYLRYNCVDKVMYALVLKQSGYSVEGAPWIKIYDLSNSPQVDDNNNNSGIPSNVLPDFSWVPPSGSVQANTEGYEASFELDPGIWKMETHINMIPGRTSSTGRGDHFVYLDITCPTESLDVSKTADPFYTEKYDWTITKTVDPDNHTMFVGETPKSSDYEVVVDQTVTPTGQKVKGEITIENNTGSTAIIADVIDVIKPNGDNNVFVDVTCGVTFPYTLAAGQTLICSYEQPLASDVDGQNEVIVPPANGSELFGGQATADFVFDANTPKETTGYPTVDVVDTKEGILQTDLGGDDTFTYSTDFGCPTDPTQYIDGKYEETYDNTAKIQKTEDGNTTVIASDDASVIKTCYAPVVSKDATPSITETLGWAINKTVTPGTLSMNAGESDTVEYTVTVGTEVIDTDYAAEGVITVKNPHPSLPMTPVAVTDVLEGGIAANVDCGGGSATLTVPANSDATCTYDINDLPNSATRINTATATLNAIGFDGTATVDFSGITPTVVGPTPSPATVTDTNPEGSPPWDNITTNWNTTYTKTLACSTDPASYGEDGHYTFPHLNTAAIKDTDKSDTAEVKVDCYAPTVVKTATPAIAQTLGWTIDKTVSPKELFMNISDAGETVHYTVTVGTEPIEELTKYTVSGEITVKNTNPDQSMTVVIADVLPDSTNMNLVCAGGLNPTIPGGGEVKCTYEAELPDDSTRTNIATATLDSMTVQGTAEVNFDGVEPTNTGPEPSPIVVTDTNPEGNPPWNADNQQDEWTWEYDKTLACSQDDLSKYNDGYYSFIHENTAAIEDTDKSATANVEVNCYAPLVSKDTDPAFTRTYTWGIEKVANIGPGDILLQVDQTYSFTYDITVNVESYEDTNVKVGGDITVQNPNPEDVMEVNVEDILPEATSLILECGGSLSVPAGGSAVCHYEAILPDNSTSSELTNLARVRLNEVPFDAQAPITFGVPTEEVDACVKVTDEILVNEPWTVGMPAGIVDVGESCVENLPWSETFTYPAAEPYITAGPYSADNASNCQLPDNPTGWIDNTATFMTVDNEISDTADEQVPVCVPQNDSCTLTQGYWKTHSEHGPAPESIGWYGIAPTLVIDENNEEIIADQEGNVANMIFFWSEQTYYQVLWTPPKGNAYYNLAHQWIATYLNQMNGSSMPADVLDAFTQAQVLLETYAPGDVDKKIGRLFKALYPILDDYNNGDIGPGHCSDDTDLFNAASLIQIDFRSLKNMM